MKTLLVPFLYLLTVLLPKFILSETSFFHHSGVLCSWSVSVTVAWHYRNVLDRGFEMAFIDSAFVQEALLSICWSQFRPLGLTNCSLTCVLYSTTHTHTYRHTYTSVYDKTSNDKPVTNVPFCWTRIEYLF